MTIPLGVNANPPRQCISYNFMSTKRQKTAVHSPCALVSVSLSAKRLQNRGIDLCKHVWYEWCSSITPKQSKTSVLAEAQYLILNGTNRYNVKLSHVDLDCSCLLLNKTAAPIHQCQLVPLRHAATSWRCLYPCSIDLRAEDWPAEHFDKERVHGRRRWWIHL